MTISELIVDLQALKCQHGAKVRRGKGPASSDGRTPSSYAEANCLRNSGESERRRHD